MLYVIYAEDHADSTEKRQSVRTAHLARLQILQDEKRLVVAGPMPLADCDDIAHSGVAGSIVIAEFSSLEAARTWANEDPYAAAGVYQNIIIRPFKRVF